MNRRTFVERIALGLAGFTILPGAGRVWKAERDTSVYWVHYSREAAQRISDRLTRDGVKHLLVEDYYELPVLPIFDNANATLVAKGKPSYFKRLFEELVPS